MAGCRRVGVTRFVANDHQVLVLTVRHLRTRSRLRWGGRRGLAEGGPRGKQTGDDDSVTHVGLPGLALLDYRDDRHIAFRPVAWRGWWFFESDPQKSFAR